MIVVERVSREEMDRRHGLARRPKRAAIRVPKALNTQQVLDLGNLIYFTFRGRAYGVPPLPYRKGLYLAELQAQAFGFEGRMTKDRLPQYHQLLKTIAASLWPLVRVTGRLRRGLRRVGLLANPFERCTEAELGELLGFFLTCRTRSGVQFQPSLEPLTTRTP